MDLVTPAGLEKLIAELAVLRSKREELVEGIKAEAEGGGVREPAVAHLGAPDELAHLDRRIAMLEDRLGSATVVQPDPADGALGVGESARVRDLDSGDSVEYRLVGAGEADPAAGSISYVSPVGSALLGRRVGDLVEVEVPGGLLRLEILEIQI
jgi:transcription elongation factor GreA